MTPRSRSGLLGAFAVVLALATTIGVAGAQDPPSWSFEPTNPQSGPGRNWFVLELQPGQVLSDSVTLTNPLDRPLSFQIYAADAFNTPSGGAFAIQEPEAPRKDIASWITLSTDAYTVQPKQQVVIPFEIRVPANAEAGDHIGGIAAKNVNPESVTTSGGVEVDIKRIVGARVYARVAGPLIPSLRVEDVRVTTDAPIIPFIGDERGTVTYTVRNTGNVRISPTAEVEVTGPFGQQLLGPLTTELQELLPGSSQVVTETFEQLPVLGPLTARVTATGPDAAASGEATRWVVPWLLIAILIAVIVLVIWRRRRRRRRRATAAHLGTADRASGNELVSPGSP